MTKLNFLTKIRTAFGVFIYLTFFTAYTFAQTAEIRSNIVSGTIIADDGNKPMVGASVSVKGTVLGTKTDESGKFTVATAAGDVLVFSYVGYAPVEITVKKQTSLGVIRMVNSTDLNDVVVIGYGSAKRKDVTGSISSLSSDEIRKSQPTTIDQALQGKVAGVVVQQVSGQPGGGVSVQIRGLSSFTNNPPLYVIDGVIIPPNGQTSLDGNGTNPLSTINPSDVATIDILKDASATAIYGSQATNGVVVITTKRGQSGAPRISYDGYIGAQKLPKYYKTMNLQDYATFMNEKSGIIGYDLRPQFANPEYLGEGTNWQKALFRTAMMQSHSVSVSGGDNRTKYLFSASYFDQEGIALASNFKRISARLNLDNKTTNWLKIGTSLQLTNAKENVGASNNSNEVIRTALIQTPDVNVQNPDGSWGGNDPNVYGASALNPFALAQIRTDKRDRYQVFSNAYAEITFTKHLSLRNEVSGNFDFGNEDVFTPTYKMGGVVQTRNTGTSTDARRFYYALRNFLTYSNTVFNNKLYLNTLLGHEAQTGNSQTLSATRSNFPSNNVQAINSGDPTTAANTGFKDQYAQESFFGRINATLKDKYLFTVNVRSDGSSKFAEGNRWVTTYSGAFAWKLSDEAFLKNVHAVNNLKLRMGYGITNNQNIRDYAYGATLSTVATALSGNSQLTATTGNPNVKWERTRSANIGLDGSILKSRIEFSADYYKRTTNDLLLSLTLPLYSGTVDATGYAPGSIQSPYVNIGSVSNTGYEFTITTYNVKAKKFTWKTNFVGSHNTNKILKLNTDGAALLGYAGNNVIAKSVVGGSIGQFYGYQTEGIFTSAADLQNHAIPVNSTGVKLPITSGTGGVWLGDVKFKDQNGDGIIDEKDQVFLGSPRPTYQLGLNNTFTYKNFDFNIFFSSNLGNKIYNQVRVSAENPNQNFGYFQSVLNYANIQKIDPSGLSTDVNNLTVTNPNTNIVRISQSSGNGNERFSDRYLEDGSFVRCKNIALGYTFSNEFLKKAHFSNLRIYANLTNVFTITKYRGYDPEIGSYNPLAAGIDNGYYAQPRVFTVGANLALQ